MTVNRLACGVPFVMVAMVMGVQTLADAPVIHFHPASLQIYYGNDHAILKTLVDRMKPGQVVVTETRGMPTAEFDRLLEAAHKKPTKVLAYLSIGELHDSEAGRFRKFLEAFLAKENPKAPFRTLEAMTLNRNREFHSLRIDVLA